MSVLRDYLDSDLDIRRHCHMIGVLALYPAGGVMARVEIPRTALFPGDRVSLAVNGKHVEDFVMDVEITS